MKSQSLELSLDDVLLFLGMRGLTGELTIESGNNLGTVMLHQGAILHASSPYSRAIGDLLVEDGIITEVELLETLKLQKKNSHAPLGGLLSQMGKVSFEIIEMMVHEQVRAAMKEFQSWNTVLCSFTDKEFKPHDSIRLSVQEFISQQLLQSARSFLAAPVGPSSPSSTPTAVSS